MPLIKKLIVTRAVTDLYGKIYRHFSTSVAKHMGISNWTKKRVKNVKESATSLYSLAIHSILIILTLYSLILIKLDVTNQFWFVPSLHSPWNSCFCRILIILLLVWCNWWLYCRSVFIRSSRPEVFFKKMFSETSQNLQENSCARVSTLIKNKKTLCVVTIAMICSNLPSIWKFQNFRRPLYNPVEHLWWSSYYKNSKPVIIFTKKLHQRCLLGF